MRMTATARMSLDDYAGFARHFARRPETHEGVKIARNHSY